MSADESVTAWLNVLKAPEQRDSCRQQAATAIYQRFIERLVQLARRRMRGVQRRVVDEEDVAHACLQSLFRGIQEGRFPKLNDRNDLWQVLLMLTERKAADAARRENAQRRGGGLVRGGSAFRVNTESGSLANGLEMIADAEPTPEFAAQFLDEIERRFRQLDEADTGDPLALRTIATLRMQDYSNDQIAQRLGCATRTVERRLQLIRKVWQE